MLCLFVVLGTCLLLCFLFCIFCCVIFFKQKTEYEMRIIDWSSDVCSSDLVDPLVILAAGTNDPLAPDLRRNGLPRRRRWGQPGVQTDHVIVAAATSTTSPVARPTRRCAAPVAQRDTRSPRPWSKAVAIRKQIGRAHV